MPRTILSLVRALLLVCGTISFVLLLATLYLWIRSYFIGEVIYFQPVAAPEEFASPMPAKPGRWHYQWNLCSSLGKVQVGRRNIGIGEEAPAGVRHYRTDNPDALTVLKAQYPLDVDWHLGGLEYFRRDRGYINTPPVKYWTWGFLLVTVPYWLLALLTAILPTILGMRLVRAVRRRSRISAGKCPRCGYDLRGGGGICPECGTEAQTTPAGV
jgi:hypothetical protein